MNKNFALIGASGYIAPRHMTSIKNTDNHLIAAYDPYDGIGILDSFFPNANFFTEFERFDRYLNMINNSDKSIDYLSICSPNYLHDAHIRYGLKSGFNVICEKPIVLNTWNLDALKEFEAENKGVVSTILQLRLHKSIIKLKKTIDNGPKNEIYKLKLDYITSRGNWYHHSWKGDIDKSGGIATNIGVHFFDMLSWIFGKMDRIEIMSKNNNTVKGKLFLERAEIDWLLSIDYNLVPDHQKLKGKRTYRSIKINGEEIEFSDGFTDLHDKSYQEILKGNGFSLNDAEESIRIIHKIRDTF